MSLIYIPESCFSNPARGLPTELAGILDHTQWLFICNQMQSVQTDANMIACLVEVVS